MSKLNSDIRDAIDNLYYDRARELIREALKDANAETYFLASQVPLDDDQRKVFLQKSLDLDPFYVPAYKAMQALKPKEVVQASSVPPAPEIVAQPTQLSPIPTSPAPSTVKVDEPPQVPKTLIAKIAHSTTLYQYPWPNAPMRSNVSSNTSCIPLARTESSKWINVLYIGTTGHEVLGWIEAAYLKEAKFGDKQVSFYDLPITQFEYNTKQDIVELSRKITQLNIVSSLLLVFSVIAAMSGIFMSWWNDSTSRYGGITTRDSTPLELVLLVAGTLFVFSVMAFRNAGAKLRNELGEGGINSWSQRLNGLRRSKQSVTENIMEDQARIAAMQIGGNLANTYLSKKMTSKSDVTIRYR